MSQELIQYAKKPANGRELASRVRQAFSPEKLRDGSAVVSHLGDFLWAIESKTPPHLYIDDEPAPPMTKADGDLWYHSAGLLTGRSHAHYYRVGGSVLGDKRFDTSAFTQDSYPKPGGPEGKVSEAMVHESQVYHGYKVSWWVYASPGVDPATPAPVMIWKDGHRFLSRDDRSRLFVVTENLIQQNKLPPMVHILIAPTVVGDAPAGRSLRSLLYDTLNDDYNKMVFGEIFPKTETMYKLRKDGYSVGACGQSSGGICAFNMAWHRPRSVSRVISRIGSFTSIQWRYGQANPENRFGFSDPAGFLNGGELYPALIRKRPRKNIRVWMEDGAHDLENDHGSWPLQNIQLANSLKSKEYDFYFTFGNAQHSTANGDAKLPEALAWVWRGYDPAKTEQTYVIDPDERAKPYFRVGIVNR